MEPRYYILLLVTTLILIGINVFEYLRHKKRRAQIPVCIHVNGTRGKSSITRLIAAGLRESGKKVCAKTTGTLPRMILPDGREYPIFRPGRANIAEQTRMVSLAAVHRADVLVIECMALQPYLQWLSESKIINATHAVISNARPDHLDIMGPTEEDVAKALCGMVPIKGKLFTCEKKNLKIIQDVCAERKTECLAISDEEIQAITSQELKGFSYIEHPDNVALALKVCESLGMDKKTALRGMHKAEPDPGALTDCEVEFFGRHLFFVNGFAANDPESTEMIWNMSLAKFSHVQKRIAIFNCRIDRPDRSLALGQAFVHWPNADCVVLMGSGTYLLAKAAVEAGYDYSKIFYADDFSVEEIFETIIGLSGSSAVIVGMGNIAGQGLELVQFFKNRSVLKMGVMPGKAA